MDSAGVFYGCVDQVTIILIVAWVAFEFVSVSAHLSPITERKIIFSSKKPHTAIRIARPAGLPSWKGRFTRSRF